MDRRWEEKEAVWRGGQGLDRRWEAAKVWRGGGRDQRPSAVPKVYYHKVILILAVGQVERCA